MKRTKFFCAALICLLFSMGSAIATNDDTNQLIARGWQPFMQFYASQDGTEAVERVREVLRLNEASLQNPDVQEELQELSDKIIKQLSLFKLDGLYNLLPIKTDNQHLMIVNNLSDDGRFRVSLGDLPINKGDLKQMGEARSVLAMTPKKKEKLYYFTMSGEANIGHTSSKDVKASSTELFCGISEAAEYSVSEEARLQVLAWYPKASPEEQQVIGQLWTAFPHTFEWVAKLFYLDSYFAEQSKDDARRMLMTLRLNRKAIAEVFADSSAYFEKMEGFINGDFTVFGIGGDWLKASVNMEKMTATLDFWVRDSNVIPSNHGQPNLSFPVNQIPDRFPFYTKANVYLDALGVKVAVTELESSWRLQYADNRVDIEGAFRQLPEIEVSGRALGIAPTALFEWLPFGIKGTVMQLLTTLVESNDKQGAKLDFSLDFETTDGSIASGKTYFDVADSFFVRLLMRTFNVRTVPSPEQAENLRDLARSLNASVSSDLQRWLTVLEQQPELANKRCVAGV